MKLSTAILRGMKLVKPARGMTLSPDKKRACVLGTALFGLRSPLLRGEARPWPLLLTIDDRYGLSCLPPIPQLPREATDRHLLSQIVNANDGLGWNRRRIALALRKAGL